jgi:hypothetical protein
MIRSKFRPDGGMDITVSLTTEEVAAIGTAEAEGLVHWFDTALWGLAMLRTGQVCRDEGAGTTEVHDSEMDTVVRDLEVEVLPCLAGIRDAAIPRHRTVSLEHPTPHRDMTSCHTRDRRTGPVPNTPVDRPGANL